MKKKLLNLLCTFFGICLFFLIFYVAFMPTALNRHIYYNIYDQEDFDVYYVSESGKVNFEITMNNDDIKKVLDKTLKYMVSEVDDLQTEVTFSNGEHQFFYTDDELSHMLDCQKLFTAFNIFSLIVLIVSLILIISIILLRKLFNHHTIKYFFIGLGISSLLVVAIAIYGLINFDQAFVLFHKIFFPQGNWTFSSYSYMIQMLPENQIFFNLAFSIIIWFFIYLLIVVSILVFLYRFLKKRSLDNQ